jgi:predicted acetyltransferase
MNTHWNIKQLQSAMLADLALCHSAFERGMVRAITGKELRERAAEIAATRQLTPGEIAIAESYGYRPY